jgi:hypothetical protein
MLVDDGSPLHHKDLRCAGICNGVFDVEAKCSDWVRIWSRACDLYNCMMPVDMFDDTTVTLSSLSMMTCTDKQILVGYDKCVWLT